jgi:hypothetical protein
VLAKAFVGSSPSYAPAVRPESTRGPRLPKSLRFRGLATSARNSSRERPKNRAPTPGASSASPVAKTNIRPPKCSFYWRLLSNPTERGDFCSILLEVLQSVRSSGLPAKRSALCCRMPALGRTTNHYQCGYGAAHGRVRAASNPWHSSNRPAALPAENASTVIASRRARSVSDSAPGPIASSDRS